MSIKIQTRSVSIVFLHLLSLLAFNLHTRKPIKFNVTHIDKIPQVKSFSCLSFGRIDFFWEFPDYKWKLGNLQSVVGLITVIIQF